jgi:hypothetical protein
MSNYTKTTDFAAKDSLPSGDAGKVIKGTEFETEFDDIATAKEQSLRQSLMILLRQSQQKLILLHPPLQGQ